MHHFGNAGILISAGEVFVGQQTDVLPHHERHGIALDVVAVGRGGVFRGVEAVRNQEVIDCLTIGFLRCSVVFVGHTEVPRDVGVSRLWDDHSARQLRLFVGIEVDDFPLQCVGVPVGLEGAFFVATPGQVARLKGQHLCVLRYFVLVGVECHPAVFEVIDSILPAFFISQLFRPYRGYAADVFRVDVLKGVLFPGFLDAVQFHVPVHELFAGWKLET